MGQIIHPNLLYLGHPAVFYLPSLKLDSPRYGAFNRTVRSLLHQFIIDNFDAYTHQKSDIQGFWRESRDGRIFHDQNEMYEVSFIGEERVHSLVEFLALTCCMLEEECLYLTMGYKAWLVLPKPCESSDIAKLLNVSD